MKFSEFANVLLPYIWYEGTKGDFVITLTNQIIEGQSGRSNKEGYKNPLKGKEQQNLRKYLNGTRNIPQKDACLILSCISKYKFEEFLRSQCSEDALAALKADIYRLLGKENVYDKCDIVNLCSDLFVEILDDLASGKKSE